MQLKVMSMAKTTPSMKSIGQTRSEALSWLERQYKARREMLSNGSPDPFTLDMVTTFNELAQQCNSMLKVSPDSPRMLEIIREQIKALKDKNETPDIKRAAVAFAKDVEGAFGRDSRSNRLRCDVFTAELLETLIKLARHG